MDLRARLQQADAELDTLRAAARRQPPAFSSPGHAPGSIRRARRQHAVGAALPPLVAAARLAFRHRSVVVAAARSAATGTCFAAGGTRAWAWIVPVNAASPRPTSAGIPGDAGPGTAFGCGGLVPLANPVHFAARPPVSRAPPWGVPLSPAAVIARAPLFAGQSQALLRTVLQECARDFLHAGCDGVYTPDTLAAIPVEETARDLAADALSAFARSVAAEAAYRRVSAVDAFLAHVGAVTPGRVATLDQRVARLRGMAALWDALFGAASAAADSLSSPLAAEPVDGALLAAYRELDWADLAPPGVVEPTFPAFADAGLHTAVDYLFRNNAARLLCQSFRAVEPGEQCSIVAIARSDAVLAGTLFVSAIKLRMFERACSQVDALHGLSPERAQRARAALMRGLGAGRWQPFQSDLVACFARTSVLHTLAAIRIHIEATYPEHLEHPSAPDAPSALCSADPLPGTLAGSATAVFSHDGERRYLVLRGPFFRDRICAWFGPAPDVYVGEAGPGDRDFAPLASDPHTHFNPSPREVAAAYDLRCAYADRSAEPPVEVSVCLRDLPELAPAAPPSPPV